MDGFQPKKYFDNGRALCWGKDLTGEEGGAMNNGEIFTLLNKSSQPHSIVLKDSYGQIREKRIFE